MIKITIINQSQYYTQYLKKSCTFMSDILLALCVETLQTKKNTKNFEQLYQCSSTQLFGILMRMFKNKEKAEECLQETYIKIWQKIDTYDKDKSKPMTWMVNIAKNTAIDTMRKNKIIADDIDNFQLSDISLNAIDTLMHQQDNQALYDCLKQLKPDVMQVLIFSYFYALTYEHIAKQLNKPVNTIKSWVHRSLPILKQCLEKINDQ